MQSINNANVDRKTPKSIFMIVINIQVLSQGCYVLWREQTSKNVVETNPKVDVNGNEVPNRL